MPNLQRSYDSLFRALADPTRRGILERLSEAPASVTELATPFDMALPSVMQHLQVLEEGGLVRSEKVGRVRTCQLVPDALANAERWIRDRRSLWERRFDRLGAVLTEDLEDLEDPKP